MKKFLLILLLALCQFLAGAVVVANEATDADLVAIHRKSLGAYQLKMSIHTILQRGPSTNLITKKIFRETSIHFDKTGKWHLIKDDPLQNDRWEVYSLGNEQRQLYFRKNRQPFRFAADPIELNRWLATALQDFYKLVEEPRRLLSQDPAKLPGKPKKSTLQDLPVLCHTWEIPTTNKLTDKKTIHLCVSENGGVIVDGNYSETTVESGDGYPLITSIEAFLKIEQVGAAVPAVEAPKIQDK